MTSDSRLPAEDSEFDAPRQLRLVPEFPGAEARGRLRRKLEALGMAHPSAMAVSKAVVAPDVAVALLESPTAYRVPGAELLVIRTEVFTTEVITDATNPRVLESLPFPAAMAPGSSDEAQFAPVEPPSAEEHDFRLAVTSLEQLIWQLDFTMDLTVRENEPKPSIALQGIMEPPLAIPTVIVGPDGAELQGAVVVREGSSRVSHAQKILGVTAHDLLVSFTEDRRQKSLIAELNTIAQSPASGISEADAARIRVATMPIDLVVGVRTDVGSPVGLGEAVDAKVAQDHLNHKQQWRESYRDAHLGATCLRAVHEEMLISDERYRWLAGQTPSGETVDGEQVFEDDRWANLLWLFTTQERTVSQAVRRPIATVLEERGRTRVGRGDRVPLAVALAMRARRGRLTAVAAERGAQLLEKSVPTAAWKTSWEPSDKGIDELAEQAIADAEARSPSAAATELGVRATWYLTKHGQISMPRNDLGAGSDRRVPSELIDDMLGSVRGIQQLARAVHDGRSGDAAALVVDDDARVELSGIGAPVPLSEKSIRTDLVPREGPPPPPPIDTRQEFMDAVAALNRKARELRGVDDRLRQISGAAAEPMYSTDGIAPAQLEDLKAVMDELQDHVREYEANWRVLDQLRKRMAE